jgi:predicted metal-dependent peptidase
MSYTEADLAAGFVKLGISRLANKYPFHAALLEKFRLEPSSSVGTMAVAPANDDVRLLFDIEFVRSLPADQLGGVLLHEVHHVVFGHLTLDRSKYQDDWAITVAMECSVNEFVQEPLPGEPVTLSLFPELPPMESTHERYERLKKIPQDGRFQISTSDNHEVWVIGDCAGDDRQVLADLVEQAAIEGGGLPKDLADALARARTHGDAPGSGIEIVLSDAQGHLDWRHVLRRYVGQVLAPHAVYHRPPRRFPELLGIMPGRCRRSGRAAALAVIDTSGSISPEDLEAIDGELARIAKAHKVLVVECDDDIRKVYQYRSRLQEVHGRGGTDLRPPLEPDFLRQHRPDVLIYFTDGFGPAPDNPPRCPIVWCLTEGGEAPATWGRVVRIGGSDASEAN